VDEELLEIVSSQMLQFARAGVDRLMDSVVQWLLCSLVGLLFGALMRHGTASRASETVAQLVAGGGRHPGGNVIRSR
jgi:uncharacterized membrane protein